MFSRQVSPSRRRSTADPSDGPVQPACSPAVCHPRYISMMVAHSPGQHLNSGCLPAGRVDLMRCPVPSP
ncbi:hypothetical protein BAUCODRAFT_473148 [Baudoinia panamericana UAMH 10762]|uniref:Uncharacterized protein n=1 Tax=Baudoinia panamericana (strain UAMH 10762) TaxID=717646 RepID=M2NB57_BAUPA|nr:uncharacterized protein BAUCODRAFT_473148 [Baudoinia panamericana UAMH 10762]EMC96384.1 hypothetical protein BAUCODRAFT_473148 [Baudoinia panamericana UAMH 10762]